MNDTSEIFEAFSIAKFWIAWVKALWASHPEFTADTTIEPRPRLTMVLACSKVAPAETTNSLRIAAGSIGKAFLISSIQA